MSSSPAAFAARGAQRVDRVRQGELFADDRRDKPAAANLSACFHAAQREQQVAPPRGETLSRDHVAEHDAPATQQPPREEIGIDALGQQYEARPAGRFEERGRARRPFSPKRRFASISERSASKPSEALTKPAATSCHSASSTSAGIRLVSRTISEKNGAVRRSIIASTSRAAWERPAGSKSLRTRDQDSAGIGTRQECDGGKFRGPDPPFAFLVVRHECGMLRDAPPHHFPGTVTEPVEEFRLVAGDAFGENLRLPERGRNFVAFEPGGSLATCRQCRAGAELRRNVLPPVQKSARSRRR